MAQCRRKVICLSSLRPDGTLERNELCWSSQTLIYIKQGDGCHLNDYSRNYIYKYITYEILPFLGTIN